MAQATSTLRLNIGCGDTRIEGYVGVDVRPCRGAELVLPAWDTSPFDADTVDEIYSRHMLEHLNPGDARRALQAWFSILRPGGLLRLIVPDLVFHARQLLGEAESWTDDARENIEHAMAGFYGWRATERGGDNEDAHRWGYTWPAIQRLLEEIGFTRIEHVQSGVDSQAWHLHVTARKPDRK
jgi:SAM-dependent methyltransferase